MSGIFEMPEGATPLSRDDILGLIPSHYTTRMQLDAHEQANILQARHWAIKSKKLRRDLFTYSGLLLLHKRMFDDTWQWAGQLRTSQTNIGVSPEQIATELYKLTKDATYWLENKVYSLNELAVRFHHKLVWIHPFPNGNGRHARMAADMLIHFHKGTPLTWGGSSLSDSSEIRKRYIQALRSADNHSFSDLIDFSCS